MTAGLRYIRLRYFSFIPSQATQDPSFSEQETASVASRLGKQWSGMATILVDGMTTRIVSLLE